MATAGDQIYFTFRDDRLYELPVAWLFRSVVGPKPFDPHGSGNYLKTTTPRCLECHNTWIGRVAGAATNIGATTHDLGVTCEKCHGGPQTRRLHQAHSVPTFVTAPSLLRQLARRQWTCVGNASNAPAPRPPFSYRPGEPLEAFFRTAANQNQENDHVADQVKYLKQSSCFQKSDTLTCVTCHHPHRPPPATSGDGSGAMARSCQKCHQPADCHEHPRLPPAVRDQCVNCHMPQFSRIQVLFHTPEDQYLPQIRPRQHRIGVYPAATQEVMLNWQRRQPGESSRQEAVRLSRALVDHWLKEAERFRQEYRFIAAIAALREALRIDPAPATRAKLDEVIAIQAKLDTVWYDALHSLSERKPSEAAALLEKLLALKPDHAQAHYRLGTIYAGEQMDQALHTFLRQPRPTPSDESGELMQGWLAYLSEAGRGDRIHRRADAITPHNRRSIISGARHWPH